ncbi:MULTISPECIES: hypothetical protein [unclassified Bartonella]
MLENKNEAFREETQQYRQVPTYKKARSRGKGAGFYVFAARK